MNPKANGELIPVGGGDTIPLIRDQLTIGRRDSCDICLRFPNISGLHCELIYRDGCWYIRDLGSTNGTKVNEQRVQQKALRPGDEISIAKRRFMIRYQMTGTPQELEEEAKPNVMGQSLLEKAGLVNPQRERPGTARPRAINPNEISLRRNDDDE